MRVLQCIDITIVQDVHGRCNTYKIVDVTCFVFTNGSISLAQADVKPQYFCIMETTFGVRQVRFNNLTAGTYDVR